MPKRELKFGVEAPHVTAHGAFRVRVNSARTLYVEVAEGGVMVRGVPVSGSEHWHLRDDGAWEGYYERPDTRFSFGAKRLDRGRMVPEDATPAQTKVVYEALREAAMGFAEANPEMLLRAEADDANNDVYRAEKEIEDLRKKLEELTEKREAALGREAAAEEALEAFGARGPGMR